MDTLELISGNFGGRMACPECTDFINPEEGSGKCRDCEGTGITSGDVSGALLARELEKLECSDCFGDGICRKCEGKGWIFEFKKDEKFR